MAALFESDRTRLAERIDGAAQLILSRERELFSKTEERAEQDALNNALHALRALRRCLVHQASEDTRQQRRFASGGRIRW